MTREELDKIKRETERAFKNYTNYFVKSVDRVKTLEPEEIIDLIEYIVFLIEKYDFKTVLKNHLEKKFLEDNR